MAKKSSAKKGGSKSKKRTTKQIASKPKTVKAKAVKSVTRAKSNQTSGLTKLHILSLVVYAGLIAATIMLMEKANFKVTLPYVTADPLGEAGGLVAASRNFYSVSMKCLVIGVIGASMVLPLLYLTALKNYYQVALEKGKNPWQWVESAVIGSVMIGAIAILSGWSDVFTIKFIALAVIMLAVFGGIRQKQIAETRADNKILAAAANLTKLYIVLTLAFGAGASVVYGLDFNAWYVYALYAGLIVAFVGYGVNLGQSANKGRVLTERNYLLWNLLIRGGFAIILLAGFGFIR